MRAALLAAYALLTPFLCWSMTTPGTAPAKNWDKELQGIAAQYTKYGRVDQLVRWSPLDCRSPSPPALRLSDSTDGQTHGQKLYSVFAKIKNWEGGQGSHGPTYLPPLVPGGEGKKRGLAPMGQVVVKEAWEPVEVTAEERHADKSADPFGSGKLVKRADPEQGELMDLLDFGEKVIPYAYHEASKKHYKAGKQAALFIMFKVDPKITGTDEGWVYGTVSSDGKTVTGSGRMASCMNCHQHAPHDRLFGLK